MIVSFYSYKGGVGRTQLCANIASFLCFKKNKRVLLWDWDYEAPGLHYFFGKNNNDIVKKGTLEILEAYTALMRGSKERINSTELKYIDTDNITSLVENDEGCIDLIAAGIYGTDFSFRSNNFDWFEFYSMLDGVNYIENLKENIQKLGYDYILIDSRTGISDYSGICNVQLPDLNVMVIAPTMQNFEGCKTIIEKIQKSEYLKIHNREAKILPILSRLDISNPYRDSWIDKFTTYFASLIKNLDNEFDLEFLPEIFRDIYFKDTLLQYNPAISAGENILFDRTTETTSTAFSQQFVNIAKYIDDIHVDGGIKFYKGIRENDWLDYSKRHSNSKRKTAIALTQVATKQSSFDEIIRYCNQAIVADSTFSLAYYHGGLAYSSNGNSEMAIAYFKKTISLNSDFNETFYPLALEYYKIGNFTEARKYLQLTIQLDPKRENEAHEKLNSLSTMVWEKELYINTVNSRDSLNVTNKETFIVADKESKKNISKTTIWVSATSTIVGILISFTYFFFFKSSNRISDIQAKVETPKDQKGVYGQSRDSVVTPGQIALKNAIDELQAGASDSPDRPNFGSFIKKYNEECGLPEGHAWSVSFVSWCYNKDHDYFKSSARTKDLERYFKQHNLVYKLPTIPHPGDIVFFDYEMTNNGKITGNRAIGIVYSYSDSILQGIEADVYDKRCRCFKVAIIGYTKKELEENNFVFAKIALPLKINEMATILLKQQLKQNQPNLDSVKAYISNNADITVKDSIWTPIHIAVKGNDTELLSMLLKRGINVNTLNKRDVSPLWTAAKYNSIDAAKLLLLQNDVNVNYISLNGTSALDLAKTVEMKKLLIAHGAKHATDLGNSSSRAKK